MNKHGHWTKEKCSEDALKYKCRGHWKKHSPTAYGKSRIKGWLGDLTKHMVLGKKPNGYWTKEAILKDSKKFNKFTEWEQNSESACVIAQRKGWLEEATAHMDKSGKHSLKTLFLQGLKECYICKKIKNLEEFNFCKNSKDQHKSGCKECRLKESTVWKRKNKDKLNKKAREKRKEDPTSFRESFLKRTYNLTLKDYENMLISQDNKCKICLINHEEAKRGLVIDHCHKTGRIRGLLCNKCNRGLGHFDDSPKLLHTAIAYLNK